MEKSEKLTPPNTPCNTAVQVLGTTIAIHNGTRTATLLRDRTASTSRRVRGHLIGCSRCLNRSSRSLSAALDILLAYFLDSQANVCRAFCPLCQCTETALSLLTPADSDSDIGCSYRQGLTRGDTRRNGCQKGVKGASKQDGPLSHVTGRRTGKRTEIEHTKAGFRANTEGVRNHDFGAWASTTTTTTTMPFTRVRNPNSQRLGTLASLQ